MNPNFGMQRCDTVMILLGIFLVTHGSLSHTDANVMTFSQRMGLGILFVGRSPLLDEADKVDIASISGLSKLQFIGLLILLGLLL